ncbi:hypothetical protein EDD21DRAFT_419705 [Dissophora ornata]|nr:hypothetical protein EDD21DRAFT_419705 [Dissophora ornata]
MTDNQYTLLCLVDGEATPFPVEIESIKTIGQLKKAIKDDNAIAFADVDAKVLTLWRVSIPVAPLNERKSIVLNEFDSAEELDPTDDISDVFHEKPPKKTIHIIVQRPQPVRTSVSSRPSTPHTTDARQVSRSSTPIPSIFIAQDKMEAELTDILKGVNHNNATNLIDAMDVEASQRKALGRFYKRPLPYHE